MSAYFQVTVVNVMGPTVLGSVGLQAFYCRMPDGEGGRLDTLDELREQLHILREYHGEDFIEKGYRYVGPMNDGTTQECNDRFPVFGNCHAIGASLEDVISWDDTRYLTKDLEIVEA